MPYVGYLTGTTAPMDYENEQNQEFALLSEKFNSNQSIKEFRQHRQCFISQNSLSLDCNSSKNPKEKKDQQLAEDEDLDDALKKASNTNNDVSFQRKVQTISRMKFLQGKQRYSRFRNPTYQNLALEVDRQVSCSLVFSD